MFHASTTAGPALEQATRALADEGTAAFDGLPGRFCMFFQPDADLTSGALGSGEALLRWWHPDFGMLRPDLSLRGTRWDDTSRIETWAAGEVARHAADWEREGTPFTVALNVSRRYLLARPFTRVIAQAIVDSGVEPTRLAVDIPVSALATDPTACTPWPVPSPTWE